MAARSASPSKPETGTPIQLTNELALLVSGMVRMTDDWFAPKPLEYGWDRSIVSRPPSHRALRMSLFGITNDMSGWLSSINAMRLLNMTIFPVTAPFGPYN